MRILSIDSSLGTQVAVVDAAPAAAGARALGQSSSGAPSGGPGAWR